MTTLQATSTQLITETGGARQFWALRNEEKSQWLSAQFGNLEARIQEKPEDSKLTLEAVNRLIIHADQLNRLLSPNPTIPDFEKLTTRSEGISELLLTHLAAAEARHNTAEAARTKQRTEQEAEKEQTRASMVQLSATPIATAKPLRADVSEEVITAAPVKPPKPKKPTSRIDPEILGSLTEMLKGADYQIEGLEFLEIKKGGMSLMTIKDHIIIALIKNTLDIKAKIKPDFAKEFNFDLLLDIRKAMVNFTERMVQKSDSRKRKLNEEEIANTFDSAFSSVLKQEPKLKQLRTELKDLQNTLNKLEAERKLDNHNKEIIRAFRYAIEGMLADLVALSSKKALDFTDYLMDKISRELSAQETIAKAENPPAITLRINFKSLSGLLTSGGAQPS